MKTLTTNTLLTSYIRTLLDFGFRVIIPDVENPTYCNISKHNRIGYIQDARIGDGLDFHSVNIPNEKNGTGYQYKSGITKPHIEDANGLLNFNGEGYFPNPNRKNYKSLDDFLKYKEKMKMNFREVTLE